MSRLIISIRDDDDLFDTGLGVMADPETPNHVILPFKNRANASDCLRIVATAITRTEDPDEREESDAGD
jgi:hypothetical protein